MNENKTYTICPKCFHVRLKASSCKLSCVSEELTRTLVRSAFNLGIGAAATNIAYRSLKNAGVFD